MVVDEIAWEENMDWEEVTRELGRKSGQYCFMETKEWESFKKEGVVNRVRCCWRGVGVH